MEPPRRLAPTTATIDMKPLLYGRTAFSGQDTPRPLKREGYTTSMGERDLTGKVAVVTGGSRGIGLAIASALVEEGVDVVVFGRSPKDLAKAKEQLTGQSSAGRPGGQVEAVQADVRDASQVAAAMTRAADRFGGIDIVVNNAGVGRFQQLTELSVEDWLAVIETNLNGVFFACRSAIPLMRQRGGGWIINVSSLAGNHPFAGGSAYCASKAGLNALSEVLMQEVRHDDIRVSCVAPGSVDTRFSAPTESPEKAWKLAASDVARVVIDLLRHDPRSLPSRIEIRPSRPRK